MRNTLLVPWLVALILLFTPQLASAHKPSDSYIHLDVQADHRVKGRWDIALRDLDYALSLDANDDGAITWGELKGRFDVVTAYALSRLQIRTGEASCNLSPTGLLVDDHSDGAYAVLTFAADCPKTLGSISIGYRLFFDLDPDHRGLLRLHHEDQIQTTIFRLSAPEQTIRLDRVDALSQSIHYVREGIWHIWIGLDHVLFLLTLLLPAVLDRRSGQWEPVRGLRGAIVHAGAIVTAFTVAHSITLTAAALGVVTAPARLVESMIAASVVVAALNNVWPVVTRRQWLMGFGFGLIHGFGFANVLMDLGLPAGRLLLALFAFNIGVELGQLTIVAAFLPLAFVLRDRVLYRRLVMPVGSLSVASLASLWLIERAFNVTLSLR
jgi:hypothetical protein